MQTNGESANVCLCVCVFVICNYSVCVYICIYVDRFMHALLVSNHITTQPRAQTDYYWVRSSVVMWFDNWMHMCNDNLEIIV
jgi:hypothetical protein